MLQLSRAGYIAREAVNDADIRRAQQLRAAAFGRPDTCDRDQFDPLCRHFLVENEGRLLACFRVSIVEGAAVARGYSGQFYDLSSLALYDGRIAEIGRFCLQPGCTDPNAVRLAWALLTQLVDEAGIGLLIGCSSFSGTCADIYHDTFSLLRGCYTAPPQWRPNEKAPEIIRFPADQTPTNRRAGLKNMPALLRSYLQLGGWVSDHAVVDRELGTLHVFTAVEVSAIPKARARALRAVAVG